MQRQNTGTAVMSWRGINILCSSNPCSSRQTTKSPWGRSLLSTLYLKSKSKRHYNIYITLCCELADDTLKQVFMTVFLDGVFISVPLGMKKCIVQYLTELEERSKTPILILKFLWFSWQQMVGFGKNIC